MRWLIILSGVVVLLLGLLPLIENAGYLPVFLDIVPRQGVYYNLLVAIAGGIITYFGISRL